MGSLLSCVSGLLYLSEKCALWGTCTALIICFIVMYIVTLGFGIGLGYNYCFVEVKTRHKKVPGHFIYPGEGRWPYGGLRQLEKTAPPVAPITGPDTSLSEEPDIITTPNDGGNNAGDIPPLRQEQELGMNDNNVDTHVGNNSEDVPPEPQGRQEISIGDESADMPSEFYLDASESQRSPDELQSPAPPNDYTDYPYNDYVRGGLQTHRSISKRRNKDGKKLVIPISGADLKSLLMKVKADDRGNYSLEITA